MFGLLGMDWMINKKREGGLIYMVFLRQMFVFFSLSFSLFLCLLVCKARKKAFFFFFFFFFFFSEHRETGTDG